MSESMEKKNFERLAGQLEALLFVSTTPVSFEELMGIFDVSDSEMMKIIDTLSTRLKSSESAIELREQADGFQLFTKECHFDFLKCYFSDDRKSRLSPASMETLAIIAYSQPLTRSQLSQIRGVNSDSIVATLINRGFVAECPSFEEGGATNLQTTDEFLNLLGIMDISELPDLSQFAPDEDTRLAIAEKISSLHESDV